MKEQEEFGYMSGQDKVIIYRHNKAVKTLKGMDAENFMMNISDMSDQQAQRYMAKLTGNFKRGNEGGE
ncbi:MAG: hypothetical protein P8X42_08140 [Calditrichaceae bacterium]|jgi:hypothetical protein